MSEDDLAKTIRYCTVVNPQDIEQHCGQAHALLSAIIGNDRTPSFDLIIYQREIGQGGLHKIS